MAVIDLSRHVQVALSVRDVEATSRRYAALFGVEPPEIRESLPRSETGMLYRGQPSDARAKLAFFRQGPVALELIEPIGGPSVWGDLLEAGGDCLHHLGYEVDDMAQAVAALGEQGCEVIQSGRFKGGQYAYMDTQHLYGAIIELLEINR